MSYIYRLHCIRCLHFHVFNFFTRILNCECFQNSPGWLKPCTLEHIGATLRVLWRLENFLCSFLKLQKRPILGQNLQKQEKIRKNSKKLTNLLSEKNLMHKNAIKIVWGIKILKLFLKNVHFQPKLWLFLKYFHCALFCATFGQIQCAFKFRIFSHPGIRLLFQEFRNLLLI